MTSQKIKFYKFNSSSSSADKITTAKAVEGAIIYIVDLRQLWIGGASPKLVVSGANDVTFANNVLTLTHYDNAGAATTQTLDFSDVASAQATFKVFEHVYNLMGATDGAQGTAAEGKKVVDYSNTNYLTSATTLVDADKALDAAIHTNTHKGAATGAVYDTQHLSQTWTTVVTDNTIAANDTLDSDIDKLDKKIAGLADEVIDNEEVTQQSFDAVANSVGLEEDMSLDLRGDTTNIISGDDNVKDALLDLADAVHNAGQVDDVKIADDSQEPTSIVSNKIATIAVDGTYNASTNKIATESTISDAIEDLDTQSDVQPVVYTTADSSNGAKLTFKGVSETNGVIGQGTGDTELQFAKVATTGAASDVSYANSTSGMTATDVQAAIDELDSRVDSMVGGMRYNGNINSATATINLSTGDVRPGDIYLASGAFPIGTTSVEAGDMIVYKGTTSSSDVALDNSNCTIIERETDTMVTAGGTLTDDYLVFGSGNKEVSVTSTVDATNYQVSASDLKTAITNANSALQSISHGTDGTYVTTTIGTKDADNDQSVGVALTTGTVTYTAKSGDTPANLSVTTGNEGVLTTDAVTPIKNYVDEKVSNVVSDLDVAEYAQASVTAANGGTTITVKGIKEDDGEIGASTSTSDTTILADGEYNDSTNKLATQSTVTNVINDLDVAEYAQASVDVDSTNHVSTLKIKGIKEDDGKIAAATTNPTFDVAIDGEYNDSTNKLATKSTVTNAINALNADVTSDDAAIATVEVKQVNGVINDVVVSNISAGVSYTASTASTQPGLTASTSTGAVTGGDIAAIKNYIDDKVQNACWEEYE